MARPPLLLSLVSAAVVMLGCAVAAATAVSPATRMKKNAAEEAPRRPDPSDARAMARWLVSQNSWGVLCTISVHLDGIPFGNVASFSDGPVGNSSGTPYFYLSTLDPTPTDLQRDARSSFTLSESPIGTCGAVDVENPTCARLTLSGTVEEVHDELERQFAAGALFSRHPEMKGWPKGHDFRFYKLVLSDIFLVDWYGGAKPLPVEEYYYGDGAAMGYLRRRLSS